MCHSRLHFSLFIGCLVHVSLKAPSNAFSLQICNNVLIHLIGYRKWAHTMANVTSNFWWFVVTYSFKDFYIYAGPHVPFLVYGVVCLLGFIFIYVFLPETQASSHEKLSVSNVIKTTYLQLLSV